MLTKHAALFPLFSSCTSTCTSFPAHTEMCSPTSHLLLITYICCGFFTCPSELTRLLRGSIPWKWTSDACFAEKKKKKKKHVSCSGYMCDINQQKCTKWLFSSAVRSCICSRAKPELVPPWVSDRLAYALWERFRKWKGVFLVCTYLLRHVFCPHAALAGVWRRPHFNHCSTHRPVGSQRGAFMTGYWHVAF